MADTLILEKSKFKVWDKKSKACFLGTQKKTTPLRNRKTKLKKVVDGRFKVFVASYLRQKATAVFSMSSKVFFCSFEIKRSHQKKNELVLCGLLTCLTTE